MAGEEAPPAVSDLEREVMEVVWEAGGEVTVREVVDRMNEASGRERAYTTLMTILSRLEGKEMLDKRRGPRSDLFAPTISRAEYLEARARVEVDALVGEYGSIARALFVEEISEADPEAAAKLKAIIEGRET